MKNISVVRFMFLFSALAMLLLSSCAENGLTEGDRRQLILPQAQELINATINGVVIDESGVPINGASVSLLSGVTPTEVTTDEYGYFTMEDVDSKGGSAFLNVSFPGKFDGYRKMSLVPKKYNYTEIMLMERDVIGTIDADLGGTLNHNSTASVTLPAGGIINAENASYSGPVNVAMTWIDPTADDLAARMIGDLSGINLDGAFQSLGSFGMLQIELTDNSGNELNIALGEEAQLVFPIPQSILDDAPSTIELWSYNEEIGTWVQEGFANKEGDEYIGNVSHFSSWNVDIMTDPISIEGKIVVNTEAGAEVGASYLQVYVCSDLFGKKGGWLCDDGSFEFYNFPKGESFKLKVYDKCGAEIYKETYGPFEEDKNLGSISVGATNDNFVRVKGNALDCNDMQLEGAELSVIQGSRREYFPIDDMGQFDFSINTCGGDNSILQIVNIADLLTIKESIPSGEEIVEFDNLKVCEEIKDFISVTPDGGETIVYTPEVRADVSIDEDSVGQAVIDVALIFESESIQDSIGSKSVLIVFKVDPETEEAFGGFMVYSTETQTCVVSEVSNFEISLTRFSKVKGDYIAGTFRAENVKCRDYETESETIISVIEGEFSAVVK